MPFYNDPQFGIEKVLVLGSKQDCPAAFRTLYTTENLARKSSDPDLHDPSYETAMTMLPIALFAIYSPTRG
jgi:hypothetical protein